MKVVLGADHAATAFKETLKAALVEEGHVVEDVSPALPRPGDDYPDYAVAVAERVAADPENLFGILACDTGIGMSIAANKVRGAHAALAVNEFAARRAREHNNANILVFGAELIAVDEAVRAAKAFLETPFSGVERHERRVRKITARESKGRE